MRVLGSAVLAFEAIVIVLAIPVAINVQDVPVGPALIGGLGLVLAAVLLMGFIGRPWAVAAGWVLQGGVVALGFVVPAMFVLGAFFALLWGAAVHLGRQADVTRSSHDVEEGAAPGAAPVNADNGANHD